MQTGLLFREWLTLSVFFAFFIHIIIFSMLESKRVVTLMHASESEKSRIYIEGDVLRPGMHCVKDGASVLEALQLAGLKDTSNLKNLDTARLAKDGERIKIRAQKLLKIRLLYPDGHEIEHDVPQGSKIDLLDQMIVDTNFRIVWKNRRKVLREGDKVVLETIDEG